MPWLHARKQALKQGIREGARSGESNAVIATAIPFAVAISSADGPAPFGDVAAGLGLLSIYSAIRSYELGIVMPSTATLAYGVPSMSEVNGWVFSKKSGKEKANDIPSWAAGKKPYPGESGKDFAERLLNEWYGLGNWSGTGPGSEYNKLKKNGDRNK